MTTGPQITVVTCLRDEGPFVVDWIAHLRAIGVTRILAYTNDCRDGTGAHRENISVDTTYSRGRSLVWLDSGRVVVAFDLKSTSKASTNVHQSGVFFTSFYQHVRAIFG